MINKSRLNKAIQKAQAKIAMQKLKDSGLDVFLNANGQKTVSKNYFTGKNGELTKEQREEIDENDRICKQCGVEFWAIIFKNDLPPDFAEG